MKPLIKEASESKAGEILQAAEQLFARQGYDGVSINAVAQQAGVSKANVFHHFGSKEELYIAVLQQVRRELTRDLTTLGASPEQDLGRNLTRIGALYLDHFLSNADRVRLFMRETLERRPGHSKAMAEKVLSQDYAAFTAVMGQARESGELRTDVNPHLPIILLMAACSAYFQWSEIIAHFPDTADFNEPEQFIRQIVEILLHGIVAR